MSRIAKAPFLILICSLLMIQVSAPFSPLPEKLRNDELAGLLGSGWFASTDCESITVGITCTVSAPITPLGGFCPAGVAPGTLCGAKFDSCPGTAPGGALNKICVGVFTNNPYDFECGVGPAVACNKMLGWCAPTSLLCTASPASAPAGCGSRTDCFY